ncbi:hypothetical protein HDU98_003766 [Podochytrium sp. JEL0797]|nr:hypothetical protein HDU98_003766 [Podochytrium sp. JEL0797]
MPLHPTAKPSSALLGWFLVVLATSIGSLPYQQLLIELECKAILGSGHDYETCAASAVVSEAAAGWSLVFQMCDQLPTLVLLLVAGGLVDGALGRRGAMRCGALSVLLGAIQFCIAAFALDHVEPEFVDLLLGLLAVLATVAGSLGSVILFRVAAVAFISDVTKPSERTFYFSLIDACFALALVIGPVLGGGLQLLGYIVPFGVMLTVAVALLAYLFLYVPETRVAQDERDARKCKNRILVDSISDTRLSLKSITKFQASLSLLLIMILMTFMISGFQVLYLFSPANRFGWTSLDTGKFAIIVAVQTILWLIVFLPRITDFATSTLRMDATVVKIRTMQVGILGAVIGFSLYGFARTGTQFLLSSIISTLTCFVSPTLRAVLSTLVETEFQGRLFGAIQILESLAMVGSAMTLNFVFRWTVDENPQACFFVVAGLMAVAGVVSVVGVTKRGVEEIRLVVGGGLGSEVEEELDLGDGVGGGGARVIGDREALL